MRARLFRLLGLTEPRSHMVLMACVSAVFGVSLVTQHARYAAGPLFTPLVEFVPLPAWGAAYLTVAALKTVCIVRYQWRPVLLCTHAVSIALFAYWCTALTIQYATSSTSTVGYPLAWWTYLYLLIRSFLMIDEPVGVPHERG